MDWFSDNDDAINKLIQQKGKAHQTYMAKLDCSRAKENFTHSKAMLQRELRLMENTWWDNKAEEIQSLADQGDARGFN